MNEEIQSISGTIIDYGEHLKQIHEMEMFYGDTTIQDVNERKIIISQKYTKKQ